jgi:DNA-binding Lrp family transcriptional regulator
LAAELGITASTVAKRVETLVESKTIDIRALQNPFKLGLTANALTPLKPTLQKLTISAISLLIILTSSKIECPDLPLR